MGTDYRAIITQEPGKRGGRPCIRGMRIAVADVLGWLAAGMSHAEIIAEYPELRIVGLDQASDQGFGRLLCASSTR
jgi:uncharacterized protein (DUF433 family)